MRNIFILSLLICYFFCAVGQTQNGYVKTRGRIVNGQHIYGNGLVGATVQIKGRNSIVVKSNNGAFSFPINSKQYVIQSVKKNGYQLVDADAVPKTYTYSVNPIYFIMDIPSQQMEDKLATERKLRRTLSRQLQQREDEIEQLKEQNKLTEEQYHKALQNLYAEQKKSQELVSQMAERYSRIDFDQLDEFNRQVSECIIEGRLTEADSLIKSKGDLKGRIALHNKHHEANVQARKSLEDSEAMELKDRNDLAEDCYNQFLIHKLQHQPDSAIFYIEQRAVLDTTNVDWLYDAACYLKECGYNQKSFQYFEFARNQYYRNGSSSEKYAYILKNIAEYYAHSGSQTNIQEAINLYNHAILEFKKINEIHRELVNCYQRLIDCYMFTSKEGASFDTIIRSHDSDILYILSMSFNVGEIDLENIYLGYLPEELHKQALDYYDRVLQKAFLTYGNYNNDLIAKVYLSMGSIYKSEANNAKTLECYNQAYDILNAIDSLSPTLAELCETIGGFYCWDIKDTISAINYFRQSVRIWDDNYGANNPRARKSYSSLGHLYSQLGDYQTAIDFLLKELNTYSRNSKGMFVLRELSEIYCKLGKYDDAIHYLKLDLEQPEGVYVSFNTSGQIIDGSHNYKLLKYRKYKQLGDLYFLKKDYLNSLETYCVYLDSIQSIGGSIYDELIGNGYIGASYLCLGDSLKAMSYLNQSIVIIESKLSSSTTESIADYSKHISDLCDQRNYANALDEILRTLQRFEELDDKIIKSNVRSIAKRINDIIVREE